MRFTLSMVVILGIFIHGTPALAAPGSVFEAPSPENLTEISHPQLRLQLLEMAEIDQLARSKGGCSAPGPSAEEMGAVDGRNTTHLKQIVEEHGWPTFSMVDRDGARSAWLLVQHADHDVKWQEHGLKLMQAHKADQISPSDLAYLTDRVLVNQGKPQLYGTQFHPVDGQRQPRPIKDADGVDKRRKKMGLTTLEEYAKFLDT